MATITKKELIDRISEKCSTKRPVVKRVIQTFLDEIVDELATGNRLEFRDFGVFESKLRAARTAQNPKTLERVEVPAKRTVKFKIGRIMRDRLYDSNSRFDPDTGLPLESTSPAVAHSDGEAPTS
ncbi:MAG TPA: HU family DNA-binding protein [Phycisphaerae bacterium]|jgi:integration host factor subunit beta